MNEYQVLLSMPRNAAAFLMEKREEYYCDSDPADNHLGSGGGAVWLLNGRLHKTGNEATGGKRIIIHSGGESRRLPAYAPQGKVLTPIPVMRWSVGQRIDQTLIDLQLPVYKGLLDKSPDGITTLIASGDICLQANIADMNIPEADVVCIGVWADAIQASRHGVFACRRETPERLDFMLQKPDTATLKELNNTHNYLMDSGVWLLSQKAVDTLQRKSTDSEGNYRYYDLYGDFGCSLGENPSAPDKETEGLTVTIIAAGDNSFHHFGTTRELVESTAAMQSLVADQRRIMSQRTVLSPTLLTQNSIFERRLDETNENIWVENSYIAKGWQLTRCNAVTGVPRNDWTLRLDEGMCVDIVATGAEEYAVRFYGYDDSMRGGIAEKTTKLMGEPIDEWLTRRSASLVDAPETDIQYARLYPVLTDIHDMGIVTRWLTTEPELEAGRIIWEKAKKVSAAELCECANLDRINAQRHEFMLHDIELMAEHRNRSVYYQLDLDDLACKIAYSTGTKTPPRPTGDENAETLMRANILRSQVEKLRGEDYRRDEDAAFEAMRSGMVSNLSNSRVTPRIAVCSDQIVWSRSPVRIDLAGGWTDTAPYALQHGGKVVNIAVELNNQPPLQVFVKPCKERHIVLKSIDMGATETVTDYASLMDFRHIGSAFSLPKSALALAGFGPEFCSGRYTTLAEQLEDFGSGLELTLLSAVPAGSGLGTSSILAATILRALGNFCGLGWDTNEICQRSLVLEQLLTSGGGWQDQYGGGLPGVKLLNTAAGWQQRPEAKWLPDTVFTSSDYRELHLLYYTGITRAAKSILVEIVKRMMLNSGTTLRLLDEMKQHAENMAEILQHGDFNAYGKAIEQTWEYKKLLDNGTEPEAIRSITDRIKDYCTGLMLPGAGGGGFLYMVAKDTDAAWRIRRILTENPANPRSRFVDMNISTAGNQVSRS